MSWFPDQFEACRLPINSQASGVEPPGHELSPGVKVERSGVFELPRRGMLKAVGATAALIAGAGALRAQDRPAARSRSESDPITGLEPITMEQFLAEAEPLAEALVTADQPNEDAYLLYLASLVCRLDSTPGFEKESDRAVQMSRTHQGPRFAVMQIKMEAGAALPFHDHFEYNGLILGLEGTVYARNFELLGDEVRPPADEPFQVRETVRSTLTPGRVSTLSRTRDNIHDLRAGENGGRVLDIFTFFPGTRGSKYMTVADDPIDTDGDVYEARWG